MRSAIAVLVSLLTSGSLLAATMDTEVTLTLSSSGMQSFASYHYYYDHVRDGAPQRYEQYHVIVNGNVDESTSIFTDVWSNMLRSYVVPQPPTCYNARISIAVHSGSFACCTSAVSFYAQAGALCLQGPPPPQEPNKSCVPIWDPDHEVYQEHCDTPLLIDLGTGGYALTSVVDGVRFDIRADGQPRRVAWTFPDAPVAFLALDRNQNGVVDDGAELFGSSTPLRSGARAMNGFQALAELDGNSDGFIDRRDASWTSLLLWLDRDHDGVSIPTELQRLSDTDLEWLDTAYRLVNRRDRWGNVFRYMAQYGVRNGASDRWQERPFYDAMLLSTADE